MMTAQEGPTVQLKCDNCQYLQLKPWDFVDVDGETHRGVSALCSKDNKTIAEHEGVNPDTPSWCSFHQNRVGRAAKIVSDAWEAYFQQASDAYTAYVEAGGQRHPMWRPDFNIDWVRKQANSTRSDAWDNMLRQIRDEVDELRLHHQDEDYIGYPGGYKVEVVGFYKPYYDNQVQRLDDIVEKLETMLKTV